MYASKVFQSMRLSPSVCSALHGHRVCVMGWTVGKPKCGPWQGRKLCRPAAFEFFDYTGIKRPTRRSFESTPKGSSGWRFPRPGRPAASTASPRRKARISWPRSKTWPPAGPPPRAHLPHSARGQVAVHMPTTRLFRWRHTFTVPCSGGLIENPRHERVCLPYLSLPGVQGPLEETHGCFCTRMLCANMKENYPFSFIWKGSAMLIAPDSTLVGVGLDSGGEYCQH